MNITLILISLAYVASRFADIWTSARGIYYGTLKSNPLYKNKYNQFDMVKNLIVSGIFYAGCLVAAILVPYLWVLFLPFIFGSFYIAFMNYRMQKANRVKQIEFLTHLAQIQDDGADRPHIEEAFNGQLITSINGRAWYTLFGWIYEPGKQVTMMSATGSSRG